MSSQSTTTLLRLLPPTSTVPGGGSPQFQATSIPKIFFGAWSQNIKDARVKLGVHLRCRAVSKPRTEEFREVLKNGLQVIEWSNESLVEDEKEEGTKPFEAPASSEIKGHVESIKGMLGAMRDGEISISAYDTAWVALVEDIYGNGGPQFPSSLDWISKNQLSDGSWGDEAIFEAHDRIINTLGCVIALITWNVHPEKSQKGLSFIKENLCKLENENAEHMPIGFEVAFPSLIEIARKLNIDIPCDSPVLKEIYDRRNLKLTRIPKEIMHKVPTTLLHSLEGMTGLEWEKLIKLQCLDGSFLFSPSSTAFALMQTKDENCLAYLNRAVQKFDGGVPNVYPVDLFEHIWAVDRLERLGISRFFKSEIKECIDYVERFWTEQGICWARNSRVHDIDDTAMGFRLLRLHGRNVSAEVFRNFKKGGEFFCFAGQSNQAVTGMFNLYRASQALFPGEKILEEAKNFSSKFLREKQASNELLDKWIITKDLPGEVGYALDMPWYGSLPRVETRFFLKQYGGENDVWIGKTLYRMPYVNNNTYLELAKMDYNNCQSLHQLEWDCIQKWCAESNLEECGLSQRSLISAYFLAMATVFEPEKSKERLAWAKTAALVETLGAYFENNGTSSDHNIRNFLYDFKNSDAKMRPINSYGRHSKTTRGKGAELVGTLVGVVNQLSLDTFVAHSRDIRHHLRSAWEAWMMTWQTEGDRHGREAELVVRMLNLCAGQEPLTPSNPQHKPFFDVTNRVCHRLRQLNHQRLLNKVQENDKCKAMAQIESDMQELVQLVVSPSSDEMDPQIKQTFLMVAKTYYYSANCSQGTLDSHIEKVLFEKVI